MSVCQNVLEVTKVKSARQTTWSFCRCAVCVWAMVL